MALTVLVDNYIHKQKNKSEILQDNNFIPNIQVILQGIFYREYWQMKGFVLIRNNIMQEEKMISFMR